jgi:hypothetical protein
MTSDIFCIFSECFSIYWAGTDYACVRLVWWFVIPIFSDMRWCACVRVCVYVCICIYIYADTHVCSICHNTMTGARFSLPANMQIETKQTIQPEGVAAEQSDTCGKIRSYKQRCVTDCVQHSASWTADSSSAGQEIPRIVWKLKIHYRIHKSTPPIPVLSQIKPICAPISLLGYSFLYCPTHLFLGLANCPSL